MATTNLPDGRTNLNIFIIFTICDITSDYSSKTRMWANAQRDGRPAEYRWRSLLNAAKFG